MKMRLYKLECVGGFAIMMDRMSDETLDGLATGVRAQIQKDRTDVEVAADKIYRHEKTHRIGLPNTMLYAALVTAGRDVPYKGKTNISTALTTKLFGLMELKEEFLEFPIPEGKEEPEWIVDKRPGRLPKDNTAVCLRRPKFDTWGFTCHVEFDADVISPSKIEELFYQAGRFQGLGSFRPNKKGPFGRFKVKSFVDVTPPEMRALDKAAPAAASSEKKSGRKSKTPADVPVKIDHEGDGDLIGGRAQLNGQPGEHLPVGAGAGSGTNNGDPE